MTTILVVEDNPMNLELMETVLEANGYDLIVARDGEEGIAAAQSHHLDLVLMDLQMPRIDGYEALIAMRKVNDALPVIAVTGTATQADKDQAFDAGFDDFIKKPFRIEALLEAIERLLV
jgi:CheY-like chemotaxis protein